MRVLIATEFFPESATGEITGGVESRAFFLARELAKCNKVYILTSRRPGSKKEGSFLGFKIFRVGPSYPYTQTGHLLKRIMFSLAACRKAKQLIADEKIEVLDGYNFFTYLVPLLAERKGIKSFLTYHEVWIGRWKKNTNQLGILGELSERLVLFMARIREARVIAVSDFTKQALIKNKITSDKIAVIPNGVSLSDYSQVHQTKISKADQPVICYVGRLTKNKRVEDLILAVDLLKRDFTSIKCLIVGSGPEEASIRKLVQLYNLEKNVEFTGYLKTHSQVLKKLRSSHIFCSPSVVEGFGITLVEAIAMGIPFVCSDIPPFREISAGKGGLHFKREDPVDLANKIKRLLGNKKLYKQCKQEEKSLIKKFDWKTLSERLEEEYSR